MLNKLLLIIVAEMILLNSLFFLSQRGSVHGYVPIALEQYCVDQGSQVMDSRPSFWDQSSPAGLNTYVDALENIVKPYLDSRLAPNSNLSKHRRDIQGAKKINFTTCPLGKL